MRQIALTKGRIAFVDDADYPALSKHKWHFQHGTGNIAYGATPWINSDGKRTQMSMHRFILKPSKGLVVDHINGDGLDNRRSNLRAVTQRQNVLNRHVPLKTHCKNGHPFSVENTYRYKTKNFNARACRTCNRIAVDKYQSTKGTNR